LLYPASPSLSILSYPLPPSPPSFLPSSLTFRPPFLCSLRSSVLLPQSSDPRTINLVSLSLGKVTMERINRTHALSSTTTTNPLPDQSVAACHPPTSARKPRIGRIADSEPHFSARPGVTGRNARARYHYRHHQEADQKCRARTRTSTRAAFSRSISNEPHITFTHTRITPGCDICGT